MEEFVIVYVTVGSAEEGARIGRILVEERLAACVNRVPGVLSVYRWQGRIEESGEELLLIKTSRNLFPALERRVCSLHSYGVPEVIATPVTAGSEAYLRWLDEQLLPGGK